MNVCILKKVHILLYLKKLLYSIMIVGVHTSTKHYSSLQVDASMAHIARSVGGRDRNRHAPVA